MFEYKRFLFVATFVVTGFVNAKDLPNFTDESLDPFDLIIIHPIEVLKE